MPMDGTTLLCGGCNVLGGVAACVLPAEMPCSLRRTTPSTHYAPRLNMDSNHPRAVYDLHPAALAMLTPYMIHAGLDARPHIRGGPVDDVPCNKTRAAECSTHVTARQLFNSR